MFKSTHAFSSFSVNNIEKAKTFYTQILGLDIAECCGGMELNIAGGNPVFIYSKDNHTPATFTVLNFPVDNIDQAVEELTSRGIKFEIYAEGNLKTDEKGICRAHDHKIAWFKDPAGNFLSVIEEK